MILPGILSSQISGHLYAGPSGAYDALATVTVPSGGASSITFSAIPQTGYSHLQIRAIYQYNTALDILAMQFNGDTAGNYSSHKIYGSGSGSPGTGNSVSASNMDLGYMVASTTGFGATVTDILDYTNTNKAKTVRTLSGTDLNGSGFINLNSNAWYNNTAGVYPAINSIKIYPTAGTFSQNTQFSLYGIK
jgi:hypothetical protein